MPVAHEGHVVLPPLAVAPDRGADQALLPERVDGGYEVPARVSARRGVGEGRRGDRARGESVDPAAVPAVLLAVEAQASFAAELTVIMALLLVMALQLVLLLVAGRLHAVLGVTGQNVISRVVGILLAALAVQFVFDGIRSAGLLAPATILSALPTSPCRPG